jgi:hypothetical protein
MMIALRAADKRHAFFSTPQMLKMAFVVYRHKQPALACSRSAGRKSLKSLKRLNVGLDVHPRKGMGVRAGQGGTRVNAAVVLTTLPILLVGSRALTSGAVNRGGRVRRDTVSVCISGASAG